MPKFVFCTAFVCLSRETTAPTNGKNHGLYFYLKNSCLPKDISCYHDNKKANNKPIAHDNLAVNHHLSFARNTE